MADPVIIQPDLVLRRRFLWGLGIATLVGAWGIYQMHVYVQGINPGSPEDYQRLLRLLTGLLWSLPVVEFSLAGWLLWQARGIFRTGQYPLPGHRVISPTPLRTGSQARRAAWVRLVVGVMLLLTIPLTIYLFMRMLALFAWLSSP